MFVIRKAGVFRKVVEVARKMRYNVYNGSQNDFKEDEMAEFSRVEIETISPDDIAAVGDADDLCIIIDELHIFRPIEDPAFDQVV